jgi:S1-C subfamily serine protease
VRPDENGACMRDRRHVVIAMLGASLAATGCNQTEVERLRLISQEIDRALNANQVLQAELNALPAQASCPTPIQESRQLSDRDLVERLERATVMVLVPQSRSGLGSGFFVGPNLILTNRHVVENAQDRKVLIVSRALQTVRQGSVVRVTMKDGVGGADFALIRLDEGTGPGYLGFTGTVRKLDGVVAVGYPGLTVTGDRNFQRLLRGDIAAAPDLNFTAGSVQAIQDGTNGLQHVLHTAQISGGNSGGPLVDRCGRVVGVNTFIRVDTEQSARANFALHARAAIAFLSAAGLPVTSQTSDCA